VATNMHLSEAHGLTYREIEADGFHIDKKVPMDMGDEPGQIVRGMGREMAGMADALEELQPDLMVVLGDRYEMLVAVSAALIFRIPVAHISGGDVTEGAYDDAIRHSITKMSHLHFATTEDYRLRVIQLGEEPGRVWNVGNIGIDNIRHLTLMERGELEEQLGLDLQRPTASVTFHPATLDREGAEAQADALLEALERVADMQYVVSLPNSDNGGGRIAERFKAWAQGHADRVRVYPSLGYVRYLSLLRCATCVIGNSSSGIVEAPSMHLPTVNIGSRQQGRIRAASVIDCRPVADEVVQAIAKARQGAAEWGDAAYANPYEQPDTARHILRIVQSYPLEQLIQKHFYDIPRP